MKAHFRSSLACVFAIFMSADAFLSKALAESDDIRLSREQWQNQIIEKRRELAGMRLERKAFTPLPPTLLSVNDELTKSIEY